MAPTVAASLFAIFLVILLDLKKIEHNLEIFLFSMGVIAIMVNSIYRSWRKSWLDELLLGDTVFDVVKIAKRPILVIRSKLVRYH